MHGTLSWDPSHARELSSHYQAAPAARIVEAVIKVGFPGRIALVSSFGAESAVLLHMAAAVDPAVPVIFLETGKLFPETLEYRDRLIDRLGLVDVRPAQPAAADLADHDPNGRLWAADPDRCCFLRKVLPLRQALKGFDAWFTGRKRYQGGARAHLEMFEAQDGRVKINPLAHWDRHRIDTYIGRNRLPRHPLEAEGYPSIGCVPCTTPVGAGEGARTGRWCGRAKTECGIHLPSPQGLQPADTR
ncbi:MAG: phosphoadenylyl-sulfate reductase [Rhodospirillales bacterium]